MSSLSVTPLRSIGEVDAGSDLAELIIVAARSEGVDLADRDVLVVTQKVVSKAEDAIEAVDPLDPLSHKPLVEREAVRVLRRRGELLLTETRHGFVCADTRCPLYQALTGYLQDLPNLGEGEGGFIRAVIRLPGADPGEIGPLGLGDVLQRLLDGAIGAGRGCLNLRG